ncbi:MAG: DUF2996 domain-containing protein [Geminocystis sp.]|nr:DUF2996 domain-containing protein [Geminocystis sp.]HIK38342.1 DUF2996 domain-containing protein [Geminocystis sp. M7585_C2015_104]MCS7148753.1 DUF2996 domain-containing protein [Geminocystis sp.]MCX8078373.1 DUF2996 domain-containing protein [Geminocystis sp.]MDW8116098.1 DUF2996 domain-containing protein [Geminocystis sp.]
MTEETKATPGAEKPAKKAKPPAVEDKPLTEFINEHFIPALKTAIAKQGITEVELEFKKAKIPVVGYESFPECWQVVGDLGGRVFSLYFLQENINGQKAFSCCLRGEKPSTLESFMIDERKATLDLMVSFTLKRLNGQKWLARN